ncbi:MAG TPA: FAD-dependent oxidoreductase [Vicinamibacterales bacterium]|nr:FAD-dependent oxidoreductase [Vicinamibacterales bacterium]
MRFQPVWTDRFPASRVPSYPRQRGALQSDVVIVGGGLVGCAAAFAFASAGVRTVMIEQARIASGSTAGSSGLMRPDPAASFREAAGRYGLRDARALWQATRRSGLDFAAALRRLAIRADVAAADALTIARGSRDAERPLRREYDAQRDAGLEVAWLGAVPIARESGVDRGVAGMRTRDGAQIDPYKAALGLAAAASRRGAQIFERTAALRVRAGRKSVEVRTASGAISAAAVVIATGYPPSDLRGLRRHFDRELQYFVTTDPLNAAMRRAAGKRSASIEDVERPKHTLRWMKDDTMLFSGAAQPVLPVRSRARAIEQRAWQLMYELSLMYPVLSGIQPTHAWDVDVARTVDGLPYLGTHRNYPRHLFALGIDPHRLGYCWLAARLLLRHFHGAPEKSDAAFGFARIL